MDEEGKLCSLHKPGGSGLTGAKLQDCMSRAVSRHKEVNKLLDEVIQSMKHK
ncbi:Exosome complex exonuclease RRP43 [Cricetulus griseus]|nr:Exosome complex exonuclease RRP43 [Cricetulus griseus]